MGSKTRFLWWCLHTWKTIEKRPITGPNAVDANGLIGMVFICRCVHCGKVRGFKVGS